MNSKALFAILAFSAIATGAARADDITIDNTPFQSSRTRAEVQAELAQYQSSGVNPWALNYDQLAQFHSGRTRAEVQAEYVAERNQVAVMNGEDSGSAYLTRLAAATQNRSATLAGTPANGQ